MNPEENPFEQLLKTSIDKLATTSASIYKDFFENNLNKLDSDIRSNIQQLIGGRDMYEYSDIALDVDLKALLNQYKVEDVVKKEFLSMVPNEKLVISHKSKDHIFLTNYGKFLGLQLNENNNYSITYKQYKFWIPKDYLILIQIMFNNSSLSIETVKTMLDTIKTQLYDRKYMPLHVLDIMKDNETLRKDKEDFIQTKRKFEEANKDFLHLMLEKEHLASEREAINKEKDRLRLVAIKLNNDRQKLDESMKKLDDLNIDDILKY
jgi:hypothetical protein